MYRSTQYPFQSFNSTLTKRRKQHYQINELMLEHFGLFDGYTNAETVWLAMKAKGIKLSISSFYNRLKELVEDNAIEKKPDGYNKFVYKAAAVKAQE